MDLYIGGVTLCQAAFKMSLVNFVLSMKSNFITGLTLRSHVKSTKHTCSKPKLKGFILIEAFKTLLNDVLMMFNDCCKCFH